MIYPFLCVSNYSPSKLYVRRVGYTCLFILYSLDSRPQSPSSFFSLFFLSFPSLFHMLGLSSLIFFSLCILYAMLSLFAVKARIHRYNRLLNMQTSSNESFLTILSFFFFFLSFLLRN